MEDGEIVEFDKPSVLLNKGEGHLYDLVEHTGPEEAVHLRKLANC